MTLKAGMSHCTDDEVIQQYVATGGDTTIILNFPENCTVLPPQEFQCETLQLANDFTSYLSKIVEFDPKLKLIYIESRRMDLLIRTLSEMEKDDLQNTQSNDTSHKKLLTKYGQICHVQYASDKDLVSTGSLKEIDYIYFFNNQELEVLICAMNAVSLTKRNVFMVQLTVEGNEPLIWAHINYYRTMAYDHVFNIGNTIVISDSDTDTTILDNSWSIITFNVSTFVNLIGYYPTLSNRYGLPVVGTVVKAITQLYQYILIKIRQGVYNSTTKYILFLNFEFFRVENSSMVLNSVAKCHRLTHDGLYGIQSMYYDANNPNVWIKFIQFDLLNGSMTCEISKPFITKDEICSMPVYWLPTKDKWRSSYLKDENSIFSPFSSKNQEFPIDNSTNSNKISDYKRGVYVSLLLQGYHLISLFVIGNLIETNDFKILLLKV